ncbi:TPA: hypothetical protein ACLKPX_004277 [Klebsiella pneumoniae]|uniref:hypothetical protein n=1 Tax=Klebsiella pneumoniae complex TaxID=3390273 RepID=UPI001918220A|nr:MULTISPECIES: hypothetical protein [Klebsiella]MBW5682240.1 hypothetical protein [Klebsiella pneumoniae]MCI8207227.1 hypothetical protein [Klebsiella pneumoniae]MDN2611870.1 hypothetical protein [Klebsiella pneumoniae]MDQ5766145.1 hypothetical protein [Klebsiella pneumoniae]MDV0625936.1 hypothetical protein [Klebsiella variicola subsp. variicola]
MKLSIVYTPSLKNVKTGLSLICVGMSLLIGKEAVIEHEMKSSDLTDAILKDLRKQQMNGEIDLTMSELRESLSRILV